MKNFIIAPLVLSMACFAGVAAADNYKGGCAMKAERIQQQITYAKAHNNSWKVAGLERALANVNTYCTDGKLNADFNKKMAQKERKVSEREAELQEAIADGDRKKIAKKRRKVAEAQAELDEIKELYY